MAGFGLNGEGGGLGILWPWVQTPLGCWINTLWGWLCLSSFWGRQNECQLAGILCRSGDPSKIVPNSPGDCLGSTNALHRVWCQWMDRWFVGLSRFVHPYRIRLKDGVSPVKEAPRRVPHSLHAYLKEKLSDMVARGVMSRVDALTD